MLRSFKIFFEKRVIKYSIPTSKKRQLFDFYLLSALQSLLPLPSVGYRELPPDLELNVTEAVDTLFPALRRDLLEAVFYSITAEFRHTSQYEDLNLETVQSDFTEKEQAAYMAYKEYYHYGKRLSPETTPKPSTSSRPPEPEKSQNSSHRNQSYKSAMYAIEKTGMTLAEWITLCGKLFKDGAWYRGYGGRAWYRICEGWLMLNRATSISGNFAAISMLQKGSKMPDVQIPMGVAIDHIYDLQHNSGSVLNKLKSYYEDGGYNWLSESLDFKRYIKSLHELLPFTSSALKSIALPILKDKLGSTQEDSLKKISIDNSLEAKNANEYVFSSLYHSPNYGYISYHYYNGKGIKPSKVVRVVDAKVVTSSELSILPTPDKMIFGKIAPHTLYCIEIDITSADEKFINSAEEVYDVREIANDTVTAVGFKVGWEKVSNGKAAYNKKTFTETGTKVFNNEDVNLAFFSWEKALKYVDTHDALEEPEPEVDGSGNFAKYNDNYTDKLLDSMATSEEDINIADDYDDEKYNY